MALVFKTRTQLVVEAIREKILSGKIEAGKPLRQAALAEELNVSRIPVREALLQLEGEGLVTFEAHKGATVTPMSLQQVEELFDLRAMLECELLRRSIPNLTKAHLEHSQALLNQLEQALLNNDSSDNWAELNSRFHTSLYAGADRPQTKDLVDTLNSNSDRYIRMHLHFEGNIEKADQQHIKLLEFCAQGKVDEACDYLREHILESKDDIRDFLLEHNLVESND